MRVKTKQSGIESETERNSNSESKRVRDNYRSRDKDNDFHRIAIVTMMVTVKEVVTLMLT